MPESGYESWTGTFDEILLTARGDVLAEPRVDDIGMLIYLHVDWLSTGQILWLLRRLPFPGSAPADLR